MVLTRVFAVVMDQLKKKHTILFLIIMNTTQLIKLNVKITSLFGFHYHVYGLQKILVSKHLVLLLVVYGLTTVVLTQKDTLDSLMDFGHLLGGYSWDVGL